MNDLMVEIFYTLIIIFLTGLGIIVIKLGKKRRERNIFNIPLSFNNENTNERVVLKEEKINTNAPVIGTVEIKKFYINTSLYNTEYHYEGLILLSKDETLTKNNFILLEPNIELVVLNNLRKLLNTIK